ncbi:hypothetical protein Btru_003245 [Bulinus truncatus]|nr:hypothetical protein Btru_003245 [Bulinus truncatus]
MALGVMIEDEICMALGAMIEDKACMALGAMIEDETCMALWAMIEDEICMALGAMIEDEICMALGAMIEDETCMALRAMIEDEICMALGAMIEDKACMALWATIEDEISDGTTIPGLCPDHPGRPLYRQHGHHLPDTYQVHSQQSGEGGQMIEPDRHLVSSFGVIIWCRLASSGGIWLHQVLSGDIWRYLVSSDVICNRYFLSRNSIVVKANGFHSHYSLTVLYSMMSVDQNVMVNC